MHIWSMFFLAGDNVHPVGRWAHCAQYDYPAFPGQLIEDSSAMNSSLERSVIGSEGGTTINRILATSPPPGEGRGEDGRRAEDAGGVLVRRVQFLSCLQGIIARREGSSESGLSRK
jgi:hypothetical protein